MAATAEGELSGLSSSPIHRTNPTKISMSINSRRILNAIHDADHSLNDPGPGGLIDPFGDMQICELSTASSETRTLANPTKPGIRFTLRMKTDGGDCTVAVSNGLNVAGDTQAVFADVGDLLEMVSVSHTTGYRWEILVNTGSVFDLS